MSRTTAAEQLAEFVVELRPEDIPETVRRAAQRCLLDAVGAAAAGFGSPAAAGVRSTAMKAFSTGAASLWFTGGRMASAGAALANSAAASSLDVDDGHRAAGGHPGASIIPAALAAAEEWGAPPDELLAAIVAGYEVGVRVAAARDFSRLDSFATGAWGAYGVAAAVGRLRRAPASHVAHALAIAGGHSPSVAVAGYSSRKGNSLKQGIPWATLTGVMADALAATGFSAPLDILDHPLHFDVDAIVAGLGSDFAIESVYFKPYACCRWAHGCIEALLQVMSEQRLAPSDLATVRVEIFPQALEFLSNVPRPGSLEQAQYSIPFCLAVAAFEGEPGLLPLSEDLLGRPDLGELAQRVELVADDVLGKDFPRVAPVHIVVATTAAEFNKTVDHPLGDPRNPLSDAELSSKFRQLAGGILEAGMCETLARAALSSDVRDVARVQQLVAHRARGSSEAETAGGESLSSRSTEQLFETA